MIILRNFLRLMCSTKCTKGLSHPSWVIAILFRAAVANQTLTSFKIPKSELQELQQMAMWCFCCYSESESLVATISNLIRKETATLNYKSLNLPFPVYMRKLFTKYSDDREQSLHSIETDLRLPLLKTVNGQKAFSYRGAKLWNSLRKEANWHLPWKLSRND